MPLTFGTRGKVIRIIRGPQGEPGAIAADDSVYSSTWDGSTEAPTQNALYDKINQMETASAITGGAISGVDITASTFSGVISDSTITGTDITGSTFSGVIDSATLTNVTIPQFRTNTTSALTIYVSTAGSDSNTGLTSGTTGALLTINKAIQEVARNRDPRGNIVTISVAPGTYDAVTLLPVPGSPNGGFPILTGTTTDPSLTHIKGGASRGVSALGMGNDWMVKGFTISATAAGACVYAHAGSWVRITDCILSTAQQALLDANYGGTLEIEGGNVKIAGDAIYAIWASHWGRFLAFGCTIETTGSRAFTEFVHGEHNSNLSFPSVTITTGGSLSGDRFGVENNSVITDVGNNVSFFPGTSAGYVRTGGQYDDVFEPVVLWKADNETRNTTGLTGDSDLLFTMTSAAKYHVDGEIFYDSNTTADFQYTLTGPTSCPYWDLRFAEQAPGTTAVNLVKSTAPSFGPNTISNATTSGGAGHLRFTGVIQTSGASGFFQFYWRPTTTLAVDLKAGSNIQISRIA